MPGIRGLRWASAKTRLAIRMR